MPTKLSLREQLNELIAQFTPMMRRAFMESINDIRSSIVLKKIIEKLEQKDIFGAIEAMNLDAVAFRPLEEAIRQTFNAGGIAATNAMPILKDPDGHRVVIRFDVRNPEAENWLKTHSTTLVTRVVEEQKEAIREVLTEGLARGDNPRQSALDIAGSVNKATGKRDGGIIGLSGPQIKYVDNARRELLSGDPRLLENYLQRVKRDKRFDKTVLKALKEGKPLPLDVVNKIVGRYSDNLLKLRADTIALHETFASLNSSRHLAFRQQIDSGKILAEDVMKTWKHTPQEHPRFQHVMMNGKKVQFEQPFTAPDGTLLLYPHAPNIPARHTLGCKCFVEYKIDFAARLVR